MTYRVLVVCTGNICRSPMGEIVVRDQLAAAGITDVEVSSAGVSAEESGNPIDPRARQVLRERGHEVPADHYAHRVSDEELRQADLILALTVGHARSLRSRLTEINQDLGKIHLWREFDGTCAIAPYGAYGPGGVLAEDREARSAKRYSNFYSSDGHYDVPDPWYGGVTDFYHTYGVIERGAQGIVEFIASMPDRS
ncbi:low molecular weight protein-tyrosine-phosphatase [Trueperella sp. LYQ143]|uniref:low molecular weight protein-tyrosine-phosphatase n=1 Tax=unclassified Trueperella TaxID=2630174 RepID=UPI0039839227